MLDAPLTDVPTIQPAAVDTPQARPHRLSWAALLARSFDIDISVCTACGGGMRIIATLTEAPLYAATSKASACQEKAGETGG